MTAAALDGVGVLVTRPVHQAAALTHAIEQAGGQAIGFPVFDIVARDENDIDADAAKLPTADISIFVSSNAVDHGFRLAAADASRVAAIGPSTRDAIEAAGGDADIIASAGFDSESLLASPAFQDVAGLNIRIFRGDGGRSLLADTLRQRGAVVDYLAVYQRRRRTYEESELQAIESRWQQGEIELVAVMSVATLGFLLEILPAAGREQLRQTRLVTPSRRVIQTASKLLPGSRATLAPGPGPADMVSALAACAKADPDDSNE